MSKAPSARKLADAFARLERVAAAGERCPGLAEGLPSSMTSALARAGKISIEVSTHNWRRINILVGPHKGKSTAPNPLAKSSTYLTIDSSGTRRNGRVVDYRKSERQQPSAPRLLPYAGKPTQ